MTRSKYLVIETEIDVLDGKAGVTNTQACVGHSQAEAPPYLK